MDTKTEFASVFIQNQPFLVEIAQYIPPKVCALHQQKVTNLCLLTRAKQTRVGKISITIPVEFTGVSGILSVSGTPGNVAGCQSLSLWERWHGEAVTERARMLTKSKKHSDTSPVCQRHRIAVLSCFILPGLPSQALTRQLPQSGSPWQRGFVFDKTDLRLLENVTECQSLPY